MIENYQSFLQTKTIEHKPSGFEVDANGLNPMLFDWQKVCVKWSLFKGKSALFEACGLGKTPQQLVWAEEVCKHTGGDVLILAPLAVSAQTVREGKKFGIDVNKCRSQRDVKDGINITNYEMIKEFDSSKFVGVILDESSILKAFMGKTKRYIIDTFMHTPYKLACTATPSPNDHMELLNHSDFLDIMPSNEALSRWFINDTMNFGTYRLKNYAVKDFWRWVSTWAVAMNTPEDIGYPKNGYNLPPLKTIKHVTKYETPYDIDKGLLFKETEILSATNLYRELRETAHDRAKLAAALVNNSDETWMIGCNTNYEADALKKAIPDAIEIRGSMSVEQKEDYILRFLSGEARRLISKPSIVGFGLNFQHCHNIASVGLSYSFEQRYQFIRRFWRFGQKEQVRDNVILSPAEMQIFNAIQIKEAKHDKMVKNMVAEFKDYQNMNNKKLSLVNNPEIKVLKGKSWEIVTGDCVTGIKDMPDNSVHFQIFSPPFSNLYIYSDAVQDMGNCKDDVEFFEHFSYLIPELKRILIPGRLCVVHCKDLVDYKVRDGMSGLRDFPGKIIREFERFGWKYHSRVTIWKDPVIEMQRTKAQGLLHAQIKRDSSMSRQGLPDYLLAFRKWPETEETSGPEPVKRERGFQGYIGEDKPYTVPTEGDDIYSIHVWQRYASPVWFDIQQTNVLNCRIARAEEDEKHICPLQLDVIRRCIHLWTIPGDIVYTPYAGVGSELYCAVELGRKAKGHELKMVYAEQGAKFLRELEARPEQRQLFS